MLQPQNITIILEISYTGLYVQVAFNYGLPFVLPNVNDTFHMLQSTFWFRMLFHFAIPYVMVWLRYWELDYVAARNLMIIDNEVSHSVLAMLCTGTTYQSNSEQALPLRVSLSTFIVLFVLCPLAAIVAHHSEDPMIRTMETFSGYSIQELNDLLSSLAVIAQSLLPQIDELSSLATHDQSLSMILHTGLDVFSSRLKTTLVGLSSFSMALPVVHQSIGRWENHTTAIPPSTTSQAVYGFYKHYIGSSCASYEVYAADVPDQMIFS